MNSTCERVGAQRPFPALPLERGWNVGFGGRPGRPFPPRGMAATRSRKLKGAHKTLTPAFRFHVLHADRFQHIDFWHRGSWLYYFWNRAVMSDKYISRLTTIRIPGFLTVVG